MSLTALTKELSDAGNGMSEILKKLKTEGDKLIASGTKPAEKDAPVYLFR